MVLEQLRSEAPSNQCKSADETDKSNHKMRLKRRSFLVAAGVAVSSSLSGCIGGIQDSVQEIEPITRFGYGGSASFKQESMTLTTATSETEPNDEKTSANTVSLGESVTGSIGADDSDWFAFNVNENQTVHIELARGTNSGVAALALFDPNGKSLKYAKATNSDPQKVSFRSGPLSGTYYVEVVDVNNGEGPYTLSLEGETPTATESTATPTPTTTTSTSDSTSDTTTTTSTDTTTTSTSTSDSTDPTSTSDTTTTTTTTSSDTTTTTTSTSTSDSTDSTSTSDTTTTSSDTTTTSTSDSTNSTGSTDSTTTHQLVIDGEGSSQLSNYEFSVSGTVEQTDDPGEDNVSGSTVTGAVAAGLDSFDYTGEITAFSLDGPAAVFVDGQEVDPATLGDSSTTTDSPTTTTTTDSPTTTTTTTPSDDFGVQGYGQYGYGGVQ